MFSLKCLLVLLLLITGAHENDPVDLLPPDDVPPGWVSQEQARAFKAEALFMHINGGAELYLEHGFVQMALKDYLKSELEVRVEIYDMGSTEGAKGIFDANTMGLTTGTEYGEACSIDDLQIVFYRSRYYVSITCFDLLEDLKKAIAALSSCVDTLITSQ